MILWDGVGFFGTKFFKLSRLEGLKFKFWHKYKEPMDNIQSILLLFALVMIAMSEIESIGTERSQASELKLSKNYEFSSSEVMPLHLMLFFEREKTLMRI